MFSALTPEEQALVDAVAAFSRKYFAPNALEWDKSHHFPIVEMRAAAELGIAAIYTHEEHGGSGLSRLDGVRIFEELAKGDPVTAAYLSIHNMCTAMIDQYGTENQRAQWIPKLSTMDTVASYCLTEPDAGSDAANLATRAVREGDDYLLTGTKQFISGGGVSDLYVVMARTGGTGPKGISTFLVEKDTPGLSFGSPELKMGWNAQPTAQVIFDQVRVPARNLLGGEAALGTGFSIAMNGLNGGRINIAACSLGGAVSAYEKTRIYLKNRIAFGQPLSDEPTIRFALADMATALEASRLMLWRAASALDTKADDSVKTDPDIVELCAMAKRFVTDACYQVADQALQLHGGNGYLHEYGIEKIVRDLRVNRILEGANEIMRVVIARAELAKD